jgi:AAA family ATP:ADP antiporter
MAHPSRLRAGVLEKILSPFTVLRPGEGANALLLTLAIFLLLTAYYILKVVREPLILAAGGAELKSYTSAAQAVLLVFLIPVYSAVANRVSRVRFITIVGLFFIANLIVFYAMAVANTPGLGVAYFIWVGIFNLLIIAHFWSFANDVYTPEQGKRLFAIIGFGQTLGAALGGVISKTLIGTLRVHELMLIAAAVLLGYILIVRIVNRRLHAHTPAGAVPAETPMQDRRGGFAIVARDRYLLLIGLLLLVLNLVNTNGEYILGRVVTGEADRLVASGAAGGGSSEEFTKQFIGKFYADYFTWVSVLTAVIQIVFVARIMRSVGVRAALFVLPLVALGAYGIIAFIPLLALIRAAKVAENSLDYSLNNTVRQALFLPTSRAAKYKAKAAIDTLFVRAGDLTSAGLVFLGTLVALQPRDFAIINMGLILVWLGIVVGIGRRYTRLVEERNAVANDAS